jgi:hypothetical protein
VDLYFYSPNTPPWSDGWEGVGWIHLDQERDKRWALMNTVMTFPFP